MQKIRKLLLVSVKTRFLSVKHSRADERGWKEGKTPSSQLQFGATFRGTSTRQTNDDI